MQSLFLQVQYTFVNAFYMGSIGHDLSMADMVMKMELTWDQNDKKMDLLQDLYSQHSDRRKEGVKILFLLLFSSSFKELMRVSNISNSNCFLATALVVSSNICFI
jgi:hypothetical protein